MRAIDADALMEASKYEFWQDGSAITPIGEYILGKFRQLIRNMPTIEPEPQWIPCSERLPEYDGEMYLVTDYCEQINRRRIHVSYCYVNREGFWSDVPLGYKVIAWMPLPQPYKGE